ncbi:MAG: hypothetical protein ABR511_01360 [Acidimicrobiales bacterium]
MNTKRFFSTKRRMAAAAVGGIALVGSGLGAYAYWTTGGTGTGSATTGTTSDVTVTQLGTISALTPGSPAQPIDFKINNPAATNQYITSVVVSITVPPGTGAGPACTTGDFTLVQPTAAYGDLTPGDHLYQPSGASLALKNTSANQDNCKSATVSLSFTAA